MKSTAALPKNLSSTLTGAGTVGSGQRLWNHAKEIIPGGNMLLSKRAEMFLPDQWPAYYSRAKGCKIWDLDGKEYTDMLFSVGQSTLGYGQPEVDEAVIGAISAGNMTTLNCPEEVRVAERLIELHPWASMVRFARTGGEVNAVAIRIARAASGKDKVAFCGYHGWHDWYLAANLGDEQVLAGHLLPGLEPNGVPKALSGSVLPFRYNNIQELEQLIEHNPDVGVIMMEVSRSSGPAEGFLEKVRQIATDNGIVLMFDECTSGFRQTFGGIHKQFGVEPDMAMFGKAIGNGYAMTAVIGKREIMEAAQASFISSTFWTERIGPVAALKTLEVMEREQSWERITDIGLQIRKGWADLAASHNLECQITGLPAINSFSFPGPSGLKYKTLITQEMLKRGFLTGNVIFACTEHSSEVIDRFFDALDPVFGLIEECENGRSVDDLLEGPVCHAGFARLA